MTDGCEHEDGTPHKTARGQFGNARTMKPHSHGHGDCLADSPTNHHDSRGVRSGEVAKVVYAAGPGILLAREMKVLAKAQDCCGTKSRLVEILKKVAHSHDGQQAGESISRAMTQSKISHVLPTIDPVYAGYACLPPVTSECQHPPRFWHLEWWWHRRRPFQLMVHSCCGSIARSNFVEQAVDVPRTKPSHYGGRDGPFKLDRQMPKFGLAAVIHSPSSTNYTAACRQFRAGMHGVV